jgi:hypothetical protein
MELYIVAEIAFQIMDHDLEVCGMLRSDFEIYSPSMRTIFHVAIENRSQILKSKIDTIQSTIRILGTKSVEYYQKIEF